MNIDKKNIKHLNTITHDTKVILFGVDQDGIIWYTVRRDGFEDTALSGADGEPTDFESWQKLPLDQSLKDPSGLAYAQKEWSTNAGNLLIEPVYGTGDDVVKSAQAPIKLISALNHLYVFRLSQTGKFLVNRFILDGIKNRLLPKMEVRYRRSKQKYEPDTNMGVGAANQAIQTRGDKGNKTGNIKNVDSLDFKDMNGKNFYEPALALNFIENTSVDKPWFTAIVIPTLDKERHRWNIFAYDNIKNSIVLYSVRSSQEGLFDIQDYSLSLPDPDTSLEVLTAQAGIVKREIKLQDYVVQNRFDATVYHDQIEQSTKAGMQLLKQATKVMLAIPVKKSGETENTTAAISFAVALHGGLSQIDLTPDTNEKLRGKTHELLLPLNTLDEIQIISDNTPPPAGKIKGMSQGSEDRLRVYSSSSLGNLRTGQNVKVSGTKSYDGYYIAKTVGDAEFEIEAVFTNNEVGQWEAQEQQETDLIFDNMFTSYEKTADGKLKIKCTSHDLSEGDEIQISGTGTSDGIYPVKQIGEDNSFLLDFNWNKGKVLNLNTIKRRGLKFDGQGDYVRTGQVNFTNTNPYENNERTISAWVWLDAYDTKPQLIIGQEDQQLELLIDTDNKMLFQANLNDGMSHTVKDVNPMPLKTWIHYAGVVSYAGETNGFASLYLTKNGNKILPVADASKREIVEDKVKKVKPPFPAHLKRNYIQFNGTNSHIEVPAYTNPTQAITVSCWAKSNTERWSDDACLITKRDAFILHPANGKAVRFYIHSNGDWRQSGEFAIDNIQEWHHYAGVYDGNKISLYIDGQKKAEQSFIGQIQAHTAAMQIGIDAPSLNRKSLNGSIADVCIWNKALTQDEIQKGMYKKLKGTEPGLVGYWPLDDKKTSDLSANKRHGEAKNNPQWQEANYFYLTADNRQAFTLNTNKYITLANADKLCLKNASFTAEAWIKSNDLSGADDQTILGMDDNQDNKCLHLVIRNKKAYMGFHGNDTAGQTELKSNEWYHISWRYNAELKEQAIFINGKLDNKGTGKNPLQGTGMVLIGRWASKYYFKGSIADVVIWNKALKDDEIFSRSKHRITGDEPGIVGAWIYTDANAHDLSPNQQHGNFQDTPEKGALPQELQKTNLTEFTRFYCGGKGLSGLKGKLSDIQVWDIARSEQIIKDSMYLQLQGNEQGLSGYWRFGGITTQNDHRVTPDFSVYDNTAQVYRDVYVSARELSRNNSLGKAIKYTNEELIAVTQGATYKETFEFRVHKPDGTYMQLAELNNTDNQGNKLFNFEYWGRNSRTAKSKISFPTGSVQMSDFEVLSDGWHKVSCTLVIPEKVSMMRSFGINNVKGKWVNETQRPANEWDQLEIRKHRIEMISDTVSLHTYTDDLKLDPLSDKQAGFKNNLSEIKQLEYQLSSKRLKLADIIEQIDLINNYAKYEREKVNLQTDVNYFNAQIQTQRSRLSDLESFPYKYTHAIRNRSLQKSLDISGANNSEILGFEHHGGANQQWEFEFIQKIDNSCYKVKVRNPHSGKYLNFNNGDPIASTSATEIEIRGNDFSLLQQSGTNNYLFLASWTQQIQESKWVESGYWDHPWYWVFGVWRDTSHWENYYRTEYYYDVKTIDNSSQTGVSWYIESYNNNISNIYQEKLNSCNNEINSINIALQPKQERLNRLTQLLNNRGSANITSLNTQKTEIQTQISQLEVQLNTKNTAFVQNLATNQQTPQTMPVVSEDNSKLTTQAAILSFARPVKGIAIQETVEGNVQLDYCDADGCIHQTIYDATADSRNSAYQQWVPDSFRACPVFKNSADKMTLNDNQSISLKQNQWTVETWFYYPCPVQANGQVYQLNALATSKDGKDHIIAVKDGKRLGTVVDGFFHDSGYDLETGLEYGWHHIAAIGYEGRTLFYINGDLIGKKEKTEDQENQARYAIVFNGKQDAALIPNFLFPVGNLTIAFWIKANSDKATGTLLSYATSSQSDQCYIDRPSNLRFALNGSISNDSGISINDGLWHHLAVTWEKSNGMLCIYKDGKEAFVQTGFQTNITNPQNGTLVLAQDQDSFGGGFEEKDAFLGEIAGCSVWSEVRTATQIASNMYKFFLGKQDNLVAYWAMNTKLIGNVQKLEDKCGTYHATLQGNPLTKLLQAQSTADIATIGNAKNGGSPFGRLAELRIWDTTLSDEEINVNRLVSLTGFEPGLLAYYRLNEAADNTAKDYSASDQKHATLSGTQWMACTLPLGYLGTKVSSYSTNSYIEVPAYTNPTQAITVSCWAKSNTENWSDYGCLVSKRDAFVFHPDLNTKNVQFFIHNGSWASSGQFTLDNIQEWHHYTGVYDGNKIYLYVDGQKKAEQSCTGQIQSDTGIMRIGLDDLDSDRKSFNGSIADVCIWNKALTATEIQKNMSRRLGGNESGLVGYWPLNDIEDGKVTDLSVNQRHGKVQNVTFKYANTLPILETEQIVSAEYSTIVTSGDNKKANAIMRRFFALANHGGQIKVFPGQRIEELALKWIGNAQFAPTLLGYMEGPPPVPSENFTVNYDYDGATSVQLSQSQDTSYSWSRSTNESHGFDMNLLLGVGWGLEGGIGIVSKITEGYAGFKGMLNLKRSTSKDSTVTATSSQNLTDRIQLVGSVETTPQFPHLGNRYIPKNVGYALVVSGLADVYILYLKRSGRMVSYQILPNEDIPLDVNTITFMMNPAYTSNGSLDGLIGSQAADQRFYRQVPDMRAQYGSLYPASYYRLEEAYDLKNQIDRWDKEREAYFANFDITQTSLDSSSLVNQTADTSNYNKYGQTSVKNSESSGTSAETDKKQQYEQTQKDQEANAASDQAEANERKQAMQQKINDPQKRVAANAAFDAWQKRMENLQIRAAKRNIANTYVWDADGGLRVEEQSFANTIEHSVGSSFALSASLGAEVDMMVTAFKMQLTALYQLEMTQTMSKALSTSQGFQLNVDINGVEKKGITNEKDYPLQPGEKVDRYRFMSFYLEGSTDHFYDFFNYVVDPEWLESNDEEARALRQVMAGKPNKAWRVLHRVTYVERPSLLGIGSDLRQDETVDQAATKVFDYFSKLEQDGERTNLSIGQMQSMLSQLNNKVDQLINK